MGWGFGGGVQIGFVLTTVSSAREFIKNSDFNPANKPVGSLSDPRFSRG